MYNLVSFAGIVVLMAFAWIFSTNRKIVNWRVIFWGVAIQMIFAFIYLMGMIFLFILITYGYILRKNWAYTLSGIIFILAIPIGLFFLFYLTRPHVKAYFGREESY